MSFFFFACFQIKATRRICVDCKSSCYVLVGLQKTKQTHTKTIPNNLKKKKRKKNNKTNQPNKNSIKASNIIGKHLPAFMNTFCGEI